MRKRLIAGNWKMNMLSEEARSLARGVVERVKGLAGKVDIILAPPYTDLDAVLGEIRGTGVMLAAQNVFWEEKGAFTGEVSPGMIADAGCSWVIVGHSERRRILGETDDMVRKKIGAALDPSAAPAHPVIVDETDSPSLGGTQPLTQAQTTGAALAPSVALGGDMAAKVALTDTCVGAYSCSDGRTVLHLHREQNTCMLGEIALDPNVAKYQEIVGTWRTEASTIDISFSNVLTRCTAIK